MIKFKIPFLPPSVNTLFYTDRSTGGRYKSATYRQFVEKMKKLLPSEKMCGKIEVEYNFYYPLFYKNGKPRKLDPANLEKALTDVLVFYGIIEDDCGAILRCIIIRSYDSPERETWVQISKLED